MNEGILSLQSAASAAQLEPSRVQFLLGEFAGAFGRHGTASPVPGVDFRDLDLLRELHRKFFLEGVPKAAIRAEHDRRRGFRTVAVTSGKGGVGKTTFSLNLAVGLALGGVRVLLFDADFGMANVHVFAGIGPMRSVLDVVEGRATLDEVVTPGPAEVHFICGPSGVGRLADLGSQTREGLSRELLRVARNYDVLILDTGAGISSAVLHFLALAEEMIVVATPNLAATLDAYGVIKAAREARISPETRVLVNQADDEAMAQSVFGRIRGCSEKFLNFSPGWLGWLPQDRAFETASRERRPLLIGNPECEGSRRVRALAGEFAIRHGLRAIEPAPSRPANRVAAA